MRAIKESFRDRCREISHYLDLLQFVEESGSEVVSRDGVKRFSMDTTTRHVMKATVFLHLYNLIESVVQKCLERIAQEISDGRLTFGDVSAEWQRCWIQGVGKTDEPLNPAKRLEALLYMCDRLLERHPMVVQPKLPSGSLDDERIYAALRHHGINLKISARLNTAVKRPVLNRSGLLKLVRKRRNDLAHGLASFGDCGRDVSIRELRGWSAIVFWYLRQVIMQFEQHLAAGDFRYRAPA